MDKGAVSRQVQHLVDLGLVDRQPDPDDGRATLLAASADGAVARLADVSRDAAIASPSGSASWTRRRPRRLRRQLAPLQRRALDGDYGDDQRSQTAVSGGSAPSDRSAGDEDLAVGQLDREPARS